MDILVSLNVKERIAPSTPFNITLIEVSKYCLSTNFKQSVGSPYILWFLSRSSNLSCQAFSKSKRKRMRFGCFLQPSPLRIGIKRCCQRYSILVQTQSESYVSR